MKNQKAGKTNTGNNRMDIKPKKRTTFNYRITKSDEEREEKYYKEGYPMEHEKYIGEGAIYE